LIMQPWNEVVIGQFHADPSASHHTSTQNPSASVTQVSIYK
jgi:hypothetical protein